MSVNDIVLFEGKEVRVTNVIGDLVVVYTDDGIRVVSEKDVCSKEPAKKARVKSKSNG